MALANPQAKITTHNNSQVATNPDVDVVFNSTMTMQKRGRSGRLTTYYGTDYG